MEATLDNGRVSLSRSVHFEPDPVAERSTILAGERALTYAYTLAAFFDHLSLPPCPLSPSPMPVAIAEESDADYRPAKPRKPGAGRGRGRGGRKPVCCVRLSTSPNVSALTVSGSMPMPTVPGLLHRTALVLKENARLMHSLLTVVHLAFLLISIYTSYMRIFLPDIRAGHAWRAS